MSDDPYHGGWRFLHSVGAIYVSGIQLAEWHDSLEGRWVIASGIHPFIEPPNKALVTDRRAAPAGGTPPRRWADPNATKNLAESSK